MLRDYTLRSWLYLIAALMAVVLLAGCASMQEGTYVEYDSAGNVVAEYTGSATGAAAIGVANRQRSQSVEWKCNEASTAAGQQACYQTAMMATVVQAIGGQDQSDVQALVQADATKYAADRQFWGNVTAASISGGTTLISQALAYSRQKTHDRELFKTFRTFAQNGGDSTYQLGEAEVGGDVNLTAIGRDGQVAGNDIGQGTLGGDLIGRDSIPTQGDGVVGGQPNVTGGEAPAEISPTDPDDVRSDASLF